jgi:radical SAM/Cys-rich protein
MIELEIAGEGDGLPDGVSIAPDGPRRTTSLKSRHAVLASPAEQLRVLAEVRISAGPSGTGQFRRDVSESGWVDFVPDALEIFQINLGKLCNMTCAHCHVDSGPDRTQENMDRATVDECVAAIARSGADTVDLTGGAPELNPHFEYLVEAVVGLGKRVMDRCNLTILTVPRFAHLPVWFAERNVEVVCSLPHYRKLGTDAQRGDGTYAKSLRALQALNEAGYGYGDPDRRLTLVTNPVGAYLAGNQASIEGEWKAALNKNHGVRFDRLIALNNMPMARYLEWLVQRGNLDEYLTRLVNAFNPQTISGLMCRNTLSVDWQGYLYDCDFNQQLEMYMDLAGVATAGGAAPDGMTAGATPDWGIAAGAGPHVRDFDLAAWQRHGIRTHRHCYGCTAGAGSGCGGAIE